VLHTFCEGSRQEAAVDDYKTDDTWPYLEYAPRMVADAMETPIDH